MFPIPFEQIIIVNIATLEQDLEKIFYKGQIDVD